MPCPLRNIAALLLFPVLLPLTNAQGKAPFLDEDFDRLHALIQPQPGESRWAGIPWQTNLAEARKKSATEDKPLFIWRAGGGEVLGRA